MERVRGRVRGRFIQDKSNKGLGREGGVKLSKIKVGNCIY